MLTKGVYQIAQPLFQKFSSTLNTQHVTQNPQGMKLFLKVLGRGLKKTRLFILRKGFGLGPQFFAVGGKKGLDMLFLPILGYFWCSVVSLVTLRIYLNYFERKNPILS